MTIDTPEDLDTTLTELAAIERNSDAEFVLIGPVDDGFIRLFWLADRQSSLHVKFTFDYFECMVGTADGLWTMGAAKAWHAARTLAATKPDPNVHDLTLPPGRQRLVSDMTPEDWHGLLSEEPA